MPGDPEAPSTPARLVSGSASPALQNYTRNNDREPDERTSLLGSDGLSTPVRSFLADGDRDATMAAIEANGRKAPTRVSTRDVAKKIKQRSKYYIPVTEWLPNYSWSLFSGDFVAGVSLACVLIPQGLSYASGLAKLTPVAGLWSTALAALVYALLGTSRQLSMGPEASLSLLIGQMVQEAVYNDRHHAHDNPEAEAAAIALVATFQVGLITLALGLLRLGFLDVVLSRALLRGFVTAVGVIITIEQSVPMLGLEAVIKWGTERELIPETPIGKAWFILQHIQKTTRITAILSFSTLAVLMICRVGKQYAVKRPGGRWLRLVPEILVIIAGTTTLTGVFRWDEKGVVVMGKIKGGSEFPIGLPLDKLQWSYFNYTFPTAFVIAIVGLVDSIVAGRENAAKYGYAVSANRDLVALGVSNVVASTLHTTGCLPSFGAITRSRLNGLIGGRTQMSSLVTSIIIILSIFFLLPSLYFLPKAVLAAIVLMVVYTILAEFPHELRFYFKVKAWTDLSQMMGTFFLTLLFSIETGLVASVVFSLILVIQKSTQTNIKIIGRHPDHGTWVPIDEEDEEHEEIPGVLVIRIRESLSFANTAQLKERLRRLELYGVKKSHPSDAPRRDSAKAVILHMGDVEDIDASAIEIIDELVQAYHERGVGIHFAHLRPKQLALFQTVGICDLLGPRHFHKDLKEAITEVESMGYGNRLQ